MKVGIDADRAISTDRSNPSDLEGEDGSGAGLDDSEVPCLSGPSDSWEGFDEFAEVLRSPEDNSLDLHDGRRDALGVISGVEEPKGVSSNS